MLSPFALFRTVLSEAKELRINSAKHLLYFVEDNQKQIPRADYSKVFKERSAPRFARDDTVRGFFSTLLA